MRREKSSQYSFRDTDLARQLKGYMDSGGLVPEDLVIEIMVKNMKGKGGKLIVDGFPGNLNQATIYENKFREMYLILLFDVQKEVLFERLAKRGILFPNLVAATDPAKLRSDDKPEILEVRINNFLTESMKACDYYNKLGKVRIVDAMSDPDSVFKTCIDVLTPTLVCIAGPPCVGKTVLSHHLQKHMNYAYLDFSEFCRARSLDTDERKAKVLMDFLDRIPFRNFVLDGFPENQRQSKIVFETFGNPLKLFYLEAEKDEIYNRIHFHTRDHSDTRKKDQLKAEFDSFVRVKEDLQNFVKDKSYFKSIDASNSADRVFSLVRDELSPVIHFVNRNENKELFNHYVRKLEKKGFLYINLDKIIEAEKTRGTPLAHKLASGNSTESIFELMRKVLYAEPTQNKKFLISNFPNSLDFLKRFPKEVCKFNLMLHFTANEGGDPEQQEKNFSEEYINVAGNYHSLGRLVPIGINDPSIVDFHSEKKNRYGIILGGPTTGKTVIAKALGKGGVVKLVLFDKFKEECIKRLTKDDVAPEDVSMPALLNELNKDLQAAPTDQLTLLDGFTWIDTTLDQLTKICGDPLFVLRMEANRDLLLKRFQTKSGVTELSEEDNENINKSLAAYNDISNRVSELAKSNSNLNIYDIDVSLPQANTIEAVKSIFRKRIFLTRCHSDNLNYQALRNTMGWLCAKYDYLFIDMEMIFNEIRKKNSHSHAVQDPNAILELIKNKVLSSKKFSRNVMIFDYLKADISGKHGGKGHRKEEHHGQDHSNHHDNHTASQSYPNSKDEIFLLEQSLGKVRACFNYTDKEEVLEVQEVLIPKPEKPVVVFI